MKISTLVIPTVLLFSLSCGQSPTQILSSVQVETSTEEEDVYVNLTVALNLGAMSLAALQVPIYHPASGISLGDLEMTRNLLGFSEVKLNLNLTSIADLSAEIARLPNGNAVPLIGGNEVVVLDVGRGGKIYVLFQESVKAIGFALTLRAFDSIGRALPGLNLFPIVPLGQVMGTAGLFTSSTSGENGLAVVADITQVFEAKVTSQKVLSLLSLHDSADDSMVTLDYRSHSISREQKRKLDGFIYKLNKRKTRLEAF